MRMLFPLGLLQLSDTVNTYLTPNNDPPSPQDNIQITNKTLFNNRCLWKGGFFSSYVVILWLLEFIADRRQNTRNRYLNPEFIGSVGLNIWETIVMM